MRKCSVIIPFYNELHLINRTVLSVLANKTNSLDFEIIICNDGDFTREQILDQFPGKVQKYINLLENMGEPGPGGARNTAIETSSGEILAFLDADDVWLPGKLAAQVAEIRNGATFVTTGYHFETKSTKMYPPAYIRSPKDIFLKRGIVTSTVIVSRKLLGNLRFKDIRFSQDIDFWFQLSQQKNFNYAAIKKIFVCYNTQGSTRNKLMQLIYFHRMLKLNNLNSITRFRVLLSYSIAGVAKHYVSWFSK